MSLFLAAAAGFLSGKAKLAQEKREEERAAREEERLLDRQKRLYQFQYDIQRRSTLDEEASDLANKVRILVTTAGMDANLAAAVVENDGYEEVQDAIKKGRLNMIAVEQIYGRFVTSPSTTSRDESQTPQSILSPEAPEKLTSSQYLEEARKFDLLITPIIANMFPDETFSSIQTNDGTVFLRSGNTVATTTANRIRHAAKEAYNKLKDDPSVGPERAYHKIANFINNTIPRVTSRGLDQNEVEALILLPLQELTFRPLFLQGPQLPPPSIAPPPEPPVAGAGTEIDWRPNLLP